MTLLASLAINDTPDVDLQGHIEQVNCNDNFFTISYFFNIIQEGFSMWPMMSFPVNIFIIWSFNRFFHYLKTA